MEGTLEGEENLISYSIKREPGEEPGAYPIHATGSETQGNYIVTYIDAVFTITPLEEEPDDDPTDDDPIEDDDPVEDDDSVEEEPDVKITDDIPSKVDIVTKQDEKKKNLVETNDPTSMTLYISLLLLSVIVVIFIRRKSH